MAFQAPPADARPSLATLAPPPPPPSPDARWVERQKQSIRMVMNERYLLVRRVEREGFRRALLACGLFVGYKFVRNRFFGRADDKAM